MKNSIVKMTHAQKKKPCFNVFALLILAQAGQLAAIAAPASPAPALAPSTTYPNLPSKKIIEYGWDDFNLQNPAFIRDNIRAMEKRPFDGLAFRLADSGGEVFNLEAYDPQKLEPQLNVLSAIKWNKFTDNFIAVFATSTMDWFSDADWQKVVAHTKFVSRAVKSAGAKGIMFDPEPYGVDRNVWYFDEKKTATGRSFDEYAQQAHKRGKQFMTALMSATPDIRVLMLYQYSRAASITKPTDFADPKKRAAAVNGDGFALLAPFTDGMLEAAGGAVQLIDGNEPSYYYQSPLDFYKSGQAMRHDNKAFAAPAVREKYGRHVRAAQSFYADWVYHLRPDLYKDIVTIGLSPEDRQRWAQQNLYYALKTSDEYVWIYNENMNWWKDENIPAGFEQALISAKAKVAGGEDLGFEVGPDVFKAAEDKVKAMQPTK